MHPPEPHPRIRLSFDVAALMADHPPKLRHPHKQLLLRLAYPEGRGPEGTVVYSRWKAMELPESFAPAATPVEGRQDVYDYRPVAVPRSAGEGPAVEWHVNFADPHLFVAYGSGLFAQDEMQAAEHPALGALREALLDKGLEAVTTEGGRDGGESTPVLVRGVERRLAVATDPDPSAGRPHGLYGNRFARAPADAITRATTVLDPPTITNLIAIAAPTGGRGEYRRDEIEYVLTTAYTAFAAARVESREAVADSNPSAGTPAPTGVRTIVHTGFWGCGAFGGNRVLMAVLQILAARMAGLDRLVFHTFDGPGSAALAEAREVLHETLEEVGSTAAGEWATAEVLDRIEGLGFAWGVSDGN